MSRPPAVIPRELLELAAKAYGQRCAFDADGRCRLPDSPRPGERVWWDPAGDGRDSFHLMCTLNLSLLVFYPYCFSGNATGYRYRERANPDIDAAARLAILRAAAEIGANRP
jgi:hypothetical protein